PKVNWYPGHIAKAERQLSETLKSVDVVIEVRDSRAPKATAHPSVGKWTAGRPRVVVLTRMDTVTSRSRDSWREAYERLGADRWEDSLVEEILFVDAKRGQGTHAISRAVYKAGRHVNERRKRRGLNDRPLRVGIIGFPNVGKSALINRLLGKKRARTANTPGITRSLQWIRSGFELLDSPGIIPSDMLDQSDALLLAACNSIGVGAYDNQAVAAYLCERIQSLVIMEKDYIAAPLWRNRCIERYGFDPLDMLFIVADNTCKGDPENAARKILQDFRMGRMGPISLQL
ncbi:predicted protein, partial [Thalassiosira pseudonana CCMP1335]